MVRLYKESNTRRYGLKGGVDTDKYFIKCKDTRDINEWLQDTRVYEYSQERAIITALLNDERFHRSMNVVVKISESATIDKEYDIASKLKDIPGFILFICKTKCYDNLDKYKNPKNQTKKIEICINNSDKDTSISKDVRMQNLLVMPYISGGSFRKYNWETHDKQFISCILQLILSLAEAFYTFGFIHSDIHLDNILLRPTKKQSVIYSIFNEQVQIDGLQICIMDFDRSFIGVNKKSTSEFYKDIQKIFNELLYTIRLTFTDQEIIMNFLNNRIFKDTPLDDIRQLLQMIKTIKSVKYKPVQSTIYNPNIF